MTKRTTHTITTTNGTSRFSNNREAMVCAIALSLHYPNTLIEVIERSGIVGQYHNGKSTEEFAAHHDAAFSFTLMTWDNVAPEEWQSGGLVNYYSIMKDGDRFHLSHCKENGTRKVATANSLSAAKDAALIDRQKRTAKAA